MEEQEKEMSTKNKINNLINSMQNKLNKRLGNFQVNQRRNIDINTFQSFGPAGMPQDSTNQKNYKNNIYKSNLHANPAYNNYINNPDIPQINEPITFNEGYKPINEYYLRNIIKEEFNNLILPYQKDNLCTSNLMESKLNEIEKKFQIIINAQNMGELNDNAKIISAYLCSNLSSDNLNKNIEKFKMEYDNLLDGLQKKIDSLNNQLNTQKLNYDSNISNIYKKIDIIDKKISENEHQEIKIYVEKNVFDEEIKKLKENQTKILNDNRNNIINLNNDFENNKRDLKKQIDNINNTLNQYISDISNNANKFYNINNNFNSLRSDFGKITEDVSQIKYQITPDLINKINSIDLNSLKQQISPNEFKTLKDNMNILETNLNSIKTMAENNDRSNYDLKKLINSVEEKQNLSNKNIENIQPLLNENILDKIKTINTKIEELSKIKPNDNDDNKEKKEEKKEEQNNKEEKKEEDTGIFTGSRRQQRNKTLNNNFSKSVNANIDEKYLNIIKQLEKINLNELQKIDFNNISTQINDLTSENKFLINKINEQNKEIAEINEKIKNLENNNNLNNNILQTNKNAFETNKYNFSKSEIRNDFKTSMFDYNDPYKREPKNTDININKIYDKEKVKNIFESNKKEEENINEDEYDDFDKDFEDNKNDIDINKEKEKNPMTLLDDKIKQKDILDNKNNFSNDVFNKKGSTNDYGKFDAYAETNILDQIMGLGGSRRNNEFNRNTNDRGTFITGSLTESKNNNIIDKKPVFEDNFKINNFNTTDKKPIFDDNFKINNNSKNSELSFKKEEKKEEKIDKKDKEKEDDFNDDFDDFDVEEI